METVSFFLPFVSKRNAFEQKHFEKEQHSYRNTRNGPIAGGGGVESIVRY